MSCLGLHFALDAEHVAALKALPGDARVEHVQEELEEGLWSEDATRAQETDKAWDAIHRALTDGELGWDNGTYPLNHAVIGGEILYDGDDYLLSLKTPEQVRDVAAALSTMTREKLRAGYDGIDAGDYRQLGDEDFEYTWEWFGGLVDFYRHAAAAGRWVLSRRTSSAPARAAPT